MKLKTMLIIFANFILATCFVLAGLTISVNAHETEKANLGNQFYIGLNLVQVSYRKFILADFINSDDVSSSFRKVSPTLTQDSPSYGTLLTIGKQIDEKLSLELGIKDYGEDKVTFNKTIDDFSGGRRTVTTSSTFSVISVTSTLLVAKYNFHSQEKYNLYGKIGLEKWKAEEKSSLVVNTNGNIFSTDGSDIEKGSDIVLAIGIDFPTKIGVFQAELAPHTFRDKAGQEILSSNFTIGYLYKF